MYDNIGCPRLYEIPNLKEGKDEDIYDHVFEDLGSPSSAMLDSIDRSSVESPENSYSVSSQLGYDGGNESDSSQQGALEDQPLSPKQDDKSRGRMMFESEVMTEFSLQKIQGNFKNLTTVRNNSWEENDNLQKNEDGIFLFVKVSAFARCIYNCTKQTWLLSFPSCWKKIYLYLGLLESLLFWWMNDSLTSKSLRIPIAS